MPQPVDSGSSSYIVWSLLAASAVITGIVYWVLPSTPSANLPYTRIQQQHQQNIVDLAFSPDGKKVASASEDGTVLVSEPNGTDQTKIESPGTDEDGLQAIPSAVAFSTDGKFLAIGYTNGFVEIFDPNNLTSEGESNISLPSVRVAGLAFGTNGQDDILAIASVGRKSSGSLSLYDLSDSGKAKIIINQPVSRVAFSFDGKLIADAYGGLVEVRNSADGTLIFSASGDTALSLAFNPDSDVLAIAEPSRVQLWYAGENEIIKSIPHRQLSQGNLFVNGQFVAYSPDGTYLAYVNEPSSSNGGYASEIEICSAADYSQISSRLDDPYIYAMAFSSRGLLATGGGPGNGAPGFGDNSAHIWSLHDLRPS